MLYRTSNIKSYGYGSEEFFFIFLFWNEILVLYSHLLH